MLQLFHIKFVNHTDATKGIVPDAKKCRRLVLLIKRIHIILLNDVEQFFEENKMGAVQKSVKPNTDSSLKGDLSIDTT